MINQLWLEKKHNVNQEIVNTPIKDGGIGLKNIEKCVLTAKIMNLKLLAFNPMEKHFLTNFKQSKAFSLLEKDLKDSGIEILELSEQKLNIQYFFQNIEITTLTTSREHYEFLVKSLITVPCFKHINMSAMEFQIYPNIIFDFITRKWKNRRLKSFDKNILYNFLMNAYLDKQENWLKNLVPHPLCFACEEYFETWHHLMFECPKLAPTIKVLNIKHWSDFFQDKTYVTPKVLVAIILSSWTESPRNYLNFFL